MSRFAQELVSHAKATSHSENEWFHKVIAGFTTFEEQIVFLMDDYEKCADQQQHKTETEIFHICFPEDKDNILMRSMYDVQIDNWLSVFPHHFFCMISQVCVCVCVCMFYATSMLYLSLEPTFHHASIDLCLHDSISRPSDL